MSRAIGIRNEFTLRADSACRAEPVPAFKRGCAL